MHIFVQFAEVNSTKFDEGTIVGMQYVFIINYAGCLIALITLSQ